MGARAKALVGFPIIFAACYLILAYVADLSNRQSVVLALLFAIAFDLVFDCFGTAKPTARFTPYWVCVWPNWYDILTDFKLIQSSEDWPAIRDSGDALPADKYSPFRNAVWYSVVNQSHDGERMLVYRNNYRSFASEIDILEDLDPVFIHRKDETYDWLRNQKVRFFMKYGREGYDLGLEVPDWWWERNKASCPQCISEEKEYACGICKLVISTIPYKEFVGYWEPIQWSMDFYDKVQKMRDENRKKLGWNTVEHEQSEVPINFPYEIKNRYFTVEHNAI